MPGNICAEEAQSSDVLDKIKVSLKKNIESLRKSSRTSALWVQYMSMIDILRKFIREKVIGSYIYSLSKLCSHTWQLQVTIPTLNLTCCIYSRCQTSQFNIPMFSNILVRDYM